VARTATPAAGTIVTAPGRAATTATRDEAGSSREAGRAAAGATRAARADQAWTRRDASQPGSPPVPCSAALPVTRPPPLAARTVPGANQLTLPPLMGVAVPIRRRARLIDVEKLPLMKAIQISETGGPDGL